MAPSATTATVDSCSTNSWAHGARFLEQSIRAGNHDPQAAYLLAMCYKRLGRIGDARQVLHKIAEADANVLLQRGILALADRDYDQAAAELEKSWQAHPASYAAAYNLMLTRLCQGNRQACIELLPRIAPLTEDPQESRFLALVRALLLAVPGEEVAVAATDQALLGTLTSAEEQRLLELIAGLGQFEAAFPLLSQLVALRPASRPALAAYFGAALAHGKLLMDRCLWEEAYSLLAGLSRRLESQALPLDTGRLMVLHNLLGACSCMLQDYERGAWYFRTVQELIQQEPDWGQRLSPHGVPQVAYIEQNLALAYEWQGRLDKAEPHWNRYFDILEGHQGQARPPDYLTNLAFEGLTRLSDLYSKKEKWSAGLAYLQRAQRLKPADNETLERLFQLLTQLKRYDEARRLLRHLRQTRPNDPQIELFELEVRDVRDVEELDRLVGDIRRTLRKYQHDPRVEERTNAVVTNLMPFLERFADQFTGQVNKVLDQMRRLPSYQVNWAMVRDVMRDLEDKFLFLRRIAQRTLGLLTNDDLRRDLTNLLHHCDRKIDQCHSLGE